MRLHGLCLFIGISEKMDTDIIQKTQQQVRRSVIYAGNKGSAQSGMDSQAPTIEHFNLYMKKGEIISVVGESGSGKTTVIRAVLGALAGGGTGNTGRYPLSTENPC